MVKPGWQTTEFWASLLNAVLMVAVAIGLIGQDAATEWTALLVPVIAAVVPLVVYIYGRSQVKIANGN